MENLRQAITASERSLAISRELGDRRDEAKDLGNLARAYETLGELERAAHTLKGALLNISAEPAAEAASRLEQLGRAGDLGGGAAALRELETRLHDLDLELRLARKAGNE